MISLTIDGKKLEVPQGTTVLRAAGMAGVAIPTLCDHPQLEPYGGCRLCLVEVEGARALQPSCTLPVSNGMVVHTDTPRVREARKFVLSLLFSERNHFCMYCQMSGGDCELHAVDKKDAIASAATADFGAPGPVIDFQAPLNHTLISDNKVKKGSWDKMFLDGRPVIVHTVHG